MALWFETGSPCLLTLVLPLDRGLAAGIMPKGTNVPSFGVGSVTLLGPSSFLCRKGTDLAALPAPPCSEEERRGLPTGAAVLMASAFSRRETSPSCRWGLVGFRTCDVGQGCVPPQPLQGLLPHLPVANGRAGPAPGVLEVL